MLLYTDQIRNFEQIVTMVIKKHYPHTVHRHILNKMTQQQLKE